MTVLLEALQNDTIHLPGQTPTAVAMSNQARLPLRLVLGAGLLLIVLLIVPALVIVGKALNPGLLPSLLSPVVTEALRLSLFTTSISLLITLVLGVPSAYFLARFSFPGKRLLDTLIDLPLVLPPTVAGLALLLTFGRRGLFAPVLENLGITIAFTSVAVIIAQVFVSAPLLIRPMKAAFANLDERLEAVALSLKASRWRTFWSVSLPLTLPQLIEGIVLAWARALGEFGATIVFAGSLQGRTQTMPLAIYAALEQDLNAALGLSALLTLVAFSLLFGFRSFVAQTSEK
ncbi:MAG: molybdate ABC transporter permease subunit [Trueperaceae bacterium]|nr:molybdate ABC transporter permease subunit [Trueperaceae bacterium]